MIQRIENENEEQFLWRIGNLKDNGVIDISWDEIADIMNKEFREDISEFRSEAAYRKPYQQAKRFDDAGVFRNNTESEREEKIRELLEELKKTKQKVSDERVAYNKTLRENARIEEDLARMEHLIKENGKTSLPIIENDCVESDNDMIIALSDFHLGSCSDNNFGVYNSDVAAERLSEYLKRIIEIKNLHNSENAFVMLLGDLINGEIHFTVQLENRENVTEQIQKTAELISSFVYELSKHFRNVFVNGVAGNHSRTSFKDQVLRGNRLDNLIPWYMKAKLDHIQNVIFIDDNNYDPTIGSCTVRGNEYLMVHGDFDSFSQAGVSKLVMMLGFKPTAIFYGHLHRCSYDDIAGVKIIRSGSFSGTSDDYTVSKRITGKPSQMICIATNRGVEACYPVELS